MPRALTRSSLPTLILLLFAGSLPAAADSSGFRDVAWGASKAEVRKSEELPLHHDMEGEIAYWNFELAGWQADGLKVKMEMVGADGVMQTLRVYFEPE